MSAAGCALVLLSWAVLFLAGGLVLRDGGWLLVGTLLSIAAALLVVLGPSEEQLDSRARNPRRQAHR